MSRQSLSVAARCPVGRPRFRPSLLTLEDRSLPSTLTVTSLADSGAGSLRDQIAAASPGDTIDFAASVRGTIRLTSGELLINKDLTIAGPGATQLSVSGNNSSRVFRVANPVVGNPTVQIGGLGITQGVAAGPSAVTSNGGGVYNTGTLTLTDCNVLFNYAVGAVGFGGGIYNGGTLTVQGGQIGGNLAVGGGGIYADFTSRLTVSRCFVVTNTSSAGGGGILDNSSNLVSVSECTIARNEANSGGGGLFNNDGGPLAVTGCVFYNNATVLQGGGAIFNGAGRVTAVNCTLTENAASTGGGGIGNRSILSTVNCTITGNSSSGLIGGGGIDDLGGSQTSLLNTIVAGNGRDGVPSDIGGGGVDSASSYNLIGTGGSGGLINGVNHNQVGVANPGLDGLGDFGGPTLTIPLLRNSPALGAGTATGAPATDQRGAPRGATVSIGAYQATADHFDISAPAAVTAGAPFNVSVTARDMFNQTDIAYVGTVYLKSTDPQAPDLDAHDFTAFDGGSFVFRGEQLFTAGQEYLIAYDASIGGVTPLLVNPGAATQLLVAADSSATAGTPFALTVTALDAYGNVATGYTGTVTFDAGGAAGVLPVNYAFQPGNQGSASFMVTLNDPGTVTLTVTDVANPALTGSAVVSVF